MGELSTMDVGRDIIVKKSFGQLTRLHETHTTFIPLQYSFLFPYEEDGYQEDILIREAISTIYMEKGFVFPLGNLLLSEFKTEKLSLGM